MYFIKVFFLLQRERSLKFFIIHSSTFILRQRRVIYSTVRLSIAHASFGICRTHRHNDNDMKCVHFRTHPSKTTVKCRQNGYWWARNICRRISIRQNYTKRVTILQNMIDFFQNKTVQTKVCCYTDVHNEKIILE